MQADTNYVFANAFISANTGLTGGGTIPTKFMKEDIGLKIYEYTNHLGNVLLTTNDKRLRIDNNSDNLIDSYLADDLSKSDYYPYGMAMVGRNTNLSDYRFGYQGSEMDNEFDGSAGSHYTTYFRQLDPRLGRWMSIDPVTQPRQSPYTSMDNNPIIFNDQMGDIVNPIKWAVAKLKGQKYYSTTGAVRGRRGRISDRPTPKPTQRASRSFRHGERHVGVGTRTSPVDNSRSITRRVGSFSSGIELSSWVRRKQDQGYNVDVQITKISTPYNDDAGEGATTTYTVSAGSSTYVSQGGDGPQYPDISVSENDEITISISRTPNDEFGRWDNCTEYTITAEVEAVKSDAHRSYYLMVPKQSGNKKETEKWKAAHTPTERDQRYYKPLLGRFGISRWWKMNYDFYDPSNPNEPIKWNKDNPVFPGK